MIRPRQWLTKPFQTWRIEGALAAVKGPGAPPLKIRHTDAQRKLNGIKAGWAKRAARVAEGL